MTTKRESGRSRTAKKAPPSPQPAGGPVRAAVNALIASKALDDDPKRSALAELARSLADSLDGGAGMAAAAVSKELRATLHDLDGDDDGDDDLFAEFERDLQTPT